MSLTGRHHFSVNCQHREDDSGATVALPRPVNPVVREWRQEYLDGFAAAAVDTAMQATNKELTYGYAFNAFTMGYRAGLKAARGE